MEAVWHSGSQYQWQKGTPVFSPGGGIAFPGLGTKLLVDAPSQSFKELCWHLPQPRSTTELQHAGARGSFPHPHPSIPMLTASFRKALCPCPSHGAQCSLTQPCPATCQGEGCRGTWITSIGVERSSWHLSLQHPEVPFAGRFGNSWGELDKGRFTALSACSGKVTAGKEIQPASCCLQTASSRSSGTVQPGFAPLQAPFGHASSPSTMDAGMQLCPMLGGAHGEWHMLRYPHLHRAICGLTQHCSHSWQVWGSGPKQHPLALAELTRLGWELCWHGCAAQCPLQTLARWLSVRQGPTLQVGPGTVAGRPGDAWSCHSCLGLC